MATKTEFNYAIIELEQMASWCYRQALDVRISIGPDTLKSDAEKGEARAQIWGFVAHELSTRASTLIIQRDKPFSDEP